MSACPEMYALLSQRASGEMAAEDAARVDAHVEGCQACRDELRVYQELFTMARVPPAETRIAELDVSTFSAYQRRRRRRVTGLTIGAGFVAAAVAASMVIAPAFLTLRSLPPPQHVATTEASQAGTANGEVVLASSTSDEVEPEDAALAALDEAVEVP